jgi:hypothetical protein
MLPPNSNDSFPIGPRSFNPCSEHGTDQFDAAEAPDHVGNIAGVNKKNTWELGPADCASISRKRRYGNPVLLTRDLDFPHSRGSIIPYHGCLQENTGVASSSSNDVEIKL